MDLVISVVVPTIPGREHHLERCVRAYQTLTTHKIELLVENGHPTCGDAWQVGAERATGDYLHLTADDLEPHEGWDAAAIETVDRDALPAPRVLNPDGTLYAAYPWGDPDDWTHIAMSVVPFMRVLDWERIGPMIPGHHYYTDNWVTYRARLIGLDVVYRRAYEFVHHWAQEGRGAGMSSEARMEHDRRLYLQAGGTL